MRITVLGQSVDRGDGALVADVERLADGVGMIEGQQHPSNHVVDVAPRPDLRAVAMDLDRQVLHGALDEDP
jgi:hypothetical protein